MELMRYSLLFFFILLKINAFCQQDFVLNIQVEDLGGAEVALLPVLDESYYEMPLKVEQEKQNNIQVFKGELMYPYLCELLIDSVSYSPPFLVHPGDNKLKIIKVNGAYRVVRLDGNLEDQLLSVYNSWFPNSYDILNYLRNEWSATEGDRQFVLRQDSLLKDSYENADSALFLFTHNHPESYYALWRLAQLIRFGYNPLLGKSFLNLDGKLRESHLGNIVASEIEKYEKVYIGQIIPDVDFEDMDGDPINLRELVAEKELTLISFWYHNCGPCIAKFPQLKKIQEAYHDLGFQIIGVSTDGREERGKWLAAIDKHELDWSNLIDMDNKAKSEFQVSVFPFSFLVNKVGEILYINISNEALTDILTRRE